MSQRASEVHQPFMESLAYRRFRRRITLSLLGITVFAGLAFAWELNANGVDDLGNFVFGIVTTSVLAVVILLSSYLTLRAYRIAESRQLRFRRLYELSLHTEERLRDSEHRLRLIADNLPVVIGYIDQNERIRFANRTYSSIFDNVPPEITGMRIADVLGPDVYRVSKPYIDAALRGNSVHFERTRMTRKGPRIDAVTYIPDFKDGVVAGIFLLVEDITQRAREEEMRKLQSLVYENSCEGMMILERTGAIMNVNPAFTALTGFTFDEVRGKHLNAIASDKNDPAFFESIRRSIIRTGQWQGEIWNRHKNGENYLMSIKFNTVFDDRGNAVRRIALFADVTEQKANEEKIWRQANFDPLTGLSNRRMFHERLRMEMKKSERAHAPMAVVFIDLDRFKEINDTLGHAAGDLLLKDAAQRFSACVRGSDLVARMGGDEFIVLLTELHTPNDAARIAEDILKRLAEPFSLGESEVHISASIGITLYPDDGQTVDVLLKNADQAMYVAKEQGCNRYHYFAPLIQEATQTCTKLAAELREALVSDQLRVAYQPIVDLRTGAIKKAEALVRWQHPVRGLLKPAEFLTIADTTGLIFSIGDWMFRQAACEARRLREFAGPDFQVSVNKSALQFRDDGSHFREWLACLAESGLPGNSMIIEVTESMMKDPGQQITEKLLAYHDAGIQVSLDDFGTASSSLLLLKRQDIDYLKINHKLIGNLGENADDNVLCEAIILIAHKLGLEVIAEGIENEQQLAILTQAGCDYGQGYALYRPVEAAELEELVNQRVLACGTCG